jgi:hypothetical protein
MGLTGMKYGLSTQFTMKGRLSIKQKASPFGF